MDRQTESGMDKQADTKKDRKTDAKIHLRKNKRGTELTFLLLT